MPVYNYKLLFLYIYTYIYIKCVCMYIYLYLYIYKQPCSEKKKSLKKKTTKKVLPGNYQCIRDPSPLGKEPGEAGIARHQQLCTKRSAKKIEIVCDKKMAFKACAVTTQLWPCSSQLQEQSRSSPASLALQLYLSGPVCSTFWKVQGCLCPLTLTPTSSQCPGTGVQGGFVPPTFVFPYRGH